MGLTLLGLAATGWGVENITTMRVGDYADVGPYKIVLEEIGRAAGPNYSEIYAVMAVRSNGQTVARIEPAKRFYPAAQDGAHRGRHRDAGARPGLCGARRGA